MAVHVYLESNAGQQCITDNGNVEGGAQIGFQVVMPLAADVGSVEQRDCITILIGSDGVVLEIPEELGQHVNVLVWP